MSHDWSNPVKSTGTPPEGNPTKNVRAIRIALDQWLREQGIINGLAGLDDATGLTGSTPALAHLVRSEDHQRINAGTRDAMRQSAMSAAARWPEDARARFQAFIMKGCLPAVGGGWVIPYSSWPEAADSFNLLYSDPSVWDEWWKDVQ